MVCVSSLNKFLGGLLFVLALPGAAAVRKETLPSPQHTALHLDKGITGVSKLGTLGQNDDGFPLDGGPSFSPPAELDTSELPKPVAIPVVNFTHALPVVNFTHVNFGGIATYSLGSVSDRPTIFLYVATCSMGLVLAGLLVCCIYDTAAQWRHRAHFNACRCKLQCVHEVLQQPTGEVHLCPICVDFLPNKGTGPSPQQVVFLCGHKFHTECANRWFLMQEEHAPGRCPVCDLAHCYSGAAENWGTNSSGDGNLGQVEEMGAACRAVNTANEVKSFLLRSLASQYPSIVTPQHVKRWMSCNTELWLAELTNPKFQSIWSKERPETVLTENQGSSNNTHNRPTAEPAFV